MAAKRDFAGVAANKLSLTAKCPLMYPEEIWLSRCRGDIALHLLFGEAEWIDRASLNLYCTGLRCECPVVYKQRRISVGCYSVECS